MAYNNQIKNIKRFSMSKEQTPNDRFVRASMYWLFGFLTCYVILLIMNYE